MASITGDCAINDSVILVPDDVNNIIPPGYLDNGSLPLDTVDVDLGILPGGGIAITGDCDTGSGIEECPPGYTWACCPDPTAPYPSGIPAPTECRIVDNTQISIYSTEVINNRVWSCGSDKIVIHNKDGTLYKTISRSHAGYTEKTQQIGCGHVTVFGDKVMIGSNILRNGLGPTAWDYQYWVPIYNIDGDFLEYWELGDFWHWDSVDVNVPNKSCNVEGLYQNGGMVAMSSCSRRNNRAGGYEYGLIIFDYYGTVVDSYRTPWVYPDAYEEAYDGLARVGDAIWVNNFHSKPSILNADFTINMFLPVPCVGTLNAWSSGGMRVLDRTDGTPYVLLLNNIGNIGTDCNQRHAHLYNYDGTHYMSIFVPDAQSFDVLYNESKFAEKLGTVDRLGDTIAIAAPSYGPDGSGKVYLYDITTGELKSEIGFSSLPYPQNGSGIGSGVKLFNDEIWMYAGNYNRQQYIKICKISWI